MKSEYRHRIGICWIGCLLFFASCGKSPAAFPAGDEGSVLLTFRAEVAGTGASVCAGEASAADDGTVNQLQVVILSREEGSAEGAAGRWAVEVNRTIGGGSVGVPLSDAYTFRVQAGCRKRIYLLANCRGLQGVGGGLLDFTNAAFVPGADGRAAIDGYVFRLGTGAGEYRYDPAAGIPMTSVYEVEVPAAEELADNEYEVPYTLYLVRAATKFSFGFTNRTGTVPADAARAIRVERVRIEKIAATQMYLMPQVRPNAAGRYWVVDSDRASVVLLGQDGGEVTARDWIEWMVTETGQADAHRYQWLTGYEVPLARAQHTSAEYVWKGGVAVAPDAKRVEAPSAVYLPESAYLAEEDAGAALGLQHYSIAFATRQRDNALEDKEEHWYAVEYAPVRLPALASLFRNTHVKVNVGFTDRNPELELQVDVEPYWEVNLEPDFGI